MSLYQDINDYHRQESDKEFYNFLKDIKDYNKSQTNKDLETGI